MACPDCERRERRADVLTVLVILLMAAGFVWAVWPR